MNAVAEHTSKRVHVHRKRLHQPLLGRVLHLGGGSRVRAGALAGFVGINPAFHAPADGGAKTGHGGERIVDDQRKNARHRFDVHADDHQRRE